MLNQAGSACKRGNREPAAATRVTCEADGLEVFSALPHRFNNRINREFWNADLQSARARHCLYFR
jgi:hypothetical protein